MSWSSKSSVLVILTAIASCGIALFYLFQKGEGADTNMPEAHIQTIGPPLAPIRANGGNVGADARSTVVENNNIPTLSLATGPSPSQVTSASLRALISNVSMPVDVQLTAAAHALRGSIVAISVGVPVESGAQSGTFQISFDPEVLEPVAIVDASGTELPLIASGTSTVELDFDTRQGASQSPVIRFVAVGQAPQATLITVSSTIWDDAGNALPVNNVMQHVLTIDP